MVHYLLVTEKFAFIAFSLDIRISTSIRKTTSFVLFVFVLVLWASSLPFNMLMPVLTCLS